MTKKIAVLVGSLRKASFNKKIAIVLRSLAPTSLTMDLIDISDLPMYNEDLDEVEPIPASWKRFREQMTTYDGVLFVTPEYNRSVPAVLKNAIDVGSRPYGQSIWSGKPGAIVSVAPGAIGGFGANHHLRQSMVFLDVPLLQQPEAYIGQAAHLFNDEGKITNPETLKFLQQFMDSYASWVEKNSVQ